MQTAKWINLDRQTSGMPIWQRGYHDHIVRHENDLTRIREYIQSNPTQWALDNENPDKPIPTRVAAVVG
jgi:putative transposase